MRIHSLDDSPNHQFQKVPRTPNNNRNINLVDIDSYVGRINLMQAYQPPSIPPNATADIRKSILDQSVNLGYLPPQTPTGVETKQDINNVGASHASLKSPYQPSPGQ